MSVWPIPGGWDTVTKEERHFCAELYRIVRQNPDQFKCLLDLINTEGQWYSDYKSRINPSSNWEIAYEMAFYRDYPSKMGSDHRKFDMALFSDNQFVIVEAKAQASYMTTNCGTHSKNASGGRDQIASFVITR